MKKEIGIIRPKLKKGNDVNINQQVSGEIKTNQSMNIDINRIPDYWGEVNSVSLFCSPIMEYPQSLKTDRRLLVFDNIVSYETVVDLINEVDSRISEFINLKSFVVDKLFNEVIQEITNRQNTIAGQGTILSQHFELIKEVLQKFTATDSEKNVNSLGGNIIGYNSLDTAFAKYGLYGFVNQLNKVFLASPEITINEVKIYILGKFFNNLLTEQEKQLYEKISKKLETIFNNLNNGNNKDNRDNNTPIRLMLYINTGGGSVNAGFKFIQFIEILKNKARKIIPEFEFVTIGNKVASMGVPLFLTGDKRYISKFSMFLIHPIHTILIGKLPDLKSYMKYAETLQEMIANYIYERIDKKLSLQQIKQMMEKETWLEPKDLIKYGFAQGYIEDTNIMDNLI